ncbi:MAG: hypothetical protein JXJ04_00965 [Spirochaetales bacterium]|nr:hypothetical protein [Spirochaetales bacterium]
MMTKCPGSYKTTLSTETIECPFCHTELEFFSDETHRVCYTCRKIVFLETTPAHCSFCKIEEECLEINQWIDGGKICFRKKD